MSWDDLRVFLAVVRTQSLTDAGRYLRVSPSTVSRRLDALERALGQRLFRRQRSGYALTPSGERLVADAEAIEAQVRAFERTARVEQDEVAGTVRLATPELLAHALIVPHLGTFCARYPALSLELLSDVRPVSLARDQADVVLRVVRPTHGAYTVRRIGSIGVDVFASEEYLARCGMPTAAGGLKAHRLIAWDQDLAYLEMARWLAPIAADAGALLRTSTYTAQLVACTVGCGLAALPVRVALSAGLRPVPVGLPPLALDLWLMVRSDLRKTRRVAVICEFLSSVFAADEDQET